MQVQSLGQEDPLKEGMASHPSILALRIPWTEELGGLQSDKVADTTEATKHAIPKSTHVGRQYNFPQFTDGKTRAQRG